MNTRFLILLLTALRTFPSIGQSPEVDTSKAIQTDTAMKIRWHCQATPSVISKNSYPLIIIDDKKFEKCSLRNIYFDTAAILFVRVLTPQNDSTKFYGNAGRNGVIIITTKKQIEWITGKQILKQNSSSLLGSYKKTLIKVDKGYFTAEEELYIQKSLIDEISINNNTTEFYMDKEFNCVVTVRLTSSGGR